LLLTPAFSRRRAPASAITWPNWSAPCAIEPDIDVTLFHGWGWSSALPEAAMPGYSRLTPLLRQIPGAYQARRWLEQKRFDQGRAQGIDLYHEPSLWPLAFDGPTVITLHDLTHLHFPETQPPARLKEIERRLAAGVQQAQVILTDSQAIADEAQAYFGLPSRTFCRGAPGRRRALSPA
jgi:hypothetical protein